MSKASKVKKAGAASGGVDGGRDDRPASASTPAKAAPSVSASAPASSQSVPDVQFQGAEKVESGVVAEVPLGNAHEVSSPIFTIDQELCGRHGVLNPAKLPKGEVLNKVIADLMSCSEPKEIVASLLRGRGELGQRMGYGSPENGSDGAATTTWTAIVLGSPRARDEMVERVKHPGKLRGEEQARLGRVAGDLGEQVEFQSPDPSSVSLEEASQSGSKTSETKDGKSIPCAPTHPPPHSSTPQPHTHVDTSSTLINTTSTTIISSPLSPPPSSPSSPPPDDADPSLTPSESPPVQLALRSPDSARDAAALAIAAINVAIGRPLQKGELLASPASTAKPQEPAAWEASKAKKKPTGSSLWGGGSSKPRQRESNAQKASSTSSLSSFKAGAEPVSGEVVVDESLEIR